MSRRTAFSAQTLAALAARPSAWRHGYDLARETGLKPGTLYPILVRLADRKMVQACWEEGEPAGRPRRHRYRLTSVGPTAATAALAVRLLRPPPLRPGRTGRPGRGGLRRPGGSLVRARDGAVDRDAGELAARFGAVGAAGSAAVG